jgi:hypothetical protein
MTKYEGFANLRSKPLPAVKEAMMQVSRVKGDKMDGKWPKRVVIDGALGVLAAQVAR